MKTEFVDVSETRKNLVVEIVDDDGQPVKAGDPILSIYSPDLVSTQQEYLLARRGHQELHQSPFGEAAAGAQSLQDATRQRKGNADAHLDGPALAVPPLERTHPQVGSWQ